jgi:hypothetical protein
LTDNLLILLSQKVAVRSAVESVLDQDSLQLRGCDE